MQIQRYATGITYDGLIRALAKSRKTDWLRDDSRGIFTFKPDLNITVREVKSDPPRPFESEEWATKFPDRHAFVEVYELYYGASFVKEYHFVALDGYRATLPYPVSAADLRITPEQYSIAEAVDLNGSLDEYMDRAGFRVSD